ncbi:MAG TPA: hypothetical protein VMZ73_06035 [Acidimicrobiales bacterium]|nr:hypothetical protein [Acidimicrobiales bacterium]
MRRIPLLLALLFVACGGDGGGTTAAGGQPSTTTPAAAPTGACGLKPLTFANERWEGSSAPAPGEGGVMWEQALTFSNPNTIPVRLTGIVVHLRLSGSGGYFFKFARSTARPVPDEMIPAGRDQQRVAHVWLAPGNTPATEDLFATTSASQGGTECPVPVERLSTSPAPAHVLALPSCEPLPTIAPC